MAAHAPRSPSGADTWFKCPGSVRMQRGVIEYPTDDSIKGTFLHEISADCLRFGLDPYDMVGVPRIVQGVRCFMDDTDAEQMTWGLDKIEELGLDKIYVEKRVSIDKWSKGDFGTLDIGGFTKNLIVVADWKWGAGEKVEVVGNRQVRIYGLAFWYYIARHHTKARKFRFIIMQPKAGQPWSTWDVTLDELLDFAEELIERAEATRDPDAGLRAGRKQCRWCRAKTFCMEHARFCLKMLGLGLDVLDEEGKWELPDVDRMTQQQKIRVADNKDIIYRWIREIESSLLSDALNGKEVPGKKAVVGRAGHRAWTNIKVVTQLLKELVGKKAFKKALRTPAQIEELVGKKQFQEIFDGFTEQPPGGPVLVSVDDKRPAIVPVASMFEDERTED